ncbi:unnamed protein product [Allacma fusca]|uniref:Uncharacterized protein n=1 Tax=Allacma fusca TaxID=39272 RepID=A0A8J2LIS1_9HEXA|nr:unnamed protein product [Allacma fusca]
MQHHLRVHQKQRCSESGPSIEWLKRVPGQTEKTDVATFGDNSEEKIALQDETASLVWYRSSGDTEHYPTQGNG